MKVFTTENEILAYCLENGISGPGFVPTMGALHEGHLSLAEAAKRQCPVIAVSIFVNPTQFNDKNDLLKYPRTLEEDLVLLSRALDHTDIIFAPTVEEMYPEPDTRVFDFGQLGTVMEGLHRPGHFNGVAQVVSRLFDIIKPSAAFFGQKDFQQLAIVRELAIRDYPKTEIVSCPIIREDDGLAMSSRNRRLLPEHRVNAGRIFSTLKHASEMAPRQEITDIKNFVISEIDKIPGFRTEYFEIVDSITLAPRESRKQATPEGHYFGCIALFAGEVRLIDNMEFRLR
ncbi:MAG TPA: pantoate--beta-alanine ligase [Bacteroidales bacterium]|nr:pantoate--beta-alanine ligase [Bacteroidales bacterium]